MNPLRKSIPLGNGVTDMGGYRITLDHVLATMLVTDSGCWKPTQKPRPKGYVLFTLDSHKVYAHRYMYEQIVGPIPEGMHLDHLCRNRWCINPEHLEPVTNRENWLRGENHMVAQMRQTHCKRGHEFTPENTLWNNAHRYCRACARAKDKARGSRR